MTSAPRDIVPQPSLTRETLQRLCAAAAAGETATFTVPGELIEGVDGLPIGMTEPKSTSAAVSAPIITRREADALGIAVGDPAFPGLRIIDAPEGDPT